MPARELSEEERRQIASRAHQRFRQIMPPWEKATVTVDKFTDADGKPKITIEKTAKKP